MTLFFKKYWITIFLSSGILVLCFMDTTPLPEAPMTNFDKLVHLIMFTGLSGSVFFDNTHYLRKKISLQRIVSGSFLFPAIFSGTIEIMQEYLTVSRTGDWLDFLWDVIGAFAGIIVCLIINNRLRNHKSRKRI